MPNYHYYILLKQLGHAGSKSDAIKGINDFNDILYNIGTYVGAIIIALAIVKLIMAMSDQNPMGKMQASIMFGVGIIAISIKPIVNLLNITTTITAETLTKRVLILFGNVLTYIGVILAAMTVIQLIMSYANERADEKANASKCLAVSIGLLSASAIFDGIITKITSSATATTKATELTEYIIGIIGKASTYIGVLMLAYGVIDLIMSVRNEDSEGKVKAGICCVVGIGLLSAVAIINAVLGLNIK